MDNIIPSMNGVPVYQSESLPCSKSEALSIPKGDNVDRQFWVALDNVVWGYFDKIMCDRKIYLSEKVFKMLKDGKLTNSI